MKSYDSPRGTVQPALFCSVSRFCYLVMCLVKRAQTLLASGSAVCGKVGKMAILDKVECWVKKWKCIYLNWINNFYIIKVYFTPCLPYFSRTLVRDCTSIDSLIDDRMNNLILGEIPSILKSKLRIRINSILSSWTRHAIHHPTKGISGERLRNFFTL